MIALLLAIAAPQTAIDAERAFAADAQSLGQWTAFRKWATDDAVMFTPQPVRAQKWLKRRKEPTKAVAWWPTASWVSCDGGLAVNTGGALFPDGSHGYFTTVWIKQPGGGWRWVLDFGDSLASPRPKPTSPVVKQASCSRATEASSSTGGGFPHNAGSAADRTLLWEWNVNATGRTRVFSAYLWDGDHYVDALEDIVAVP